MKIILYLSASIMVSLMSMINCFGLILSTLLSPTRISLYSMLPQVD